MLTRMRVHAHAYTGAQVHSIENTMSWGIFQNWLTYSGMLLLVLRIMIATHCHPRLSLLTGALNYALNDLMHFALLCALVYTSFGFMARYSFGQTYDEFKDSITTFFVTQPRIMLGDYEFDYNDSYYYYYE